MNIDQVKGAAKEVAGKLQEAVGEVIGSTNQRAKGIAKQIEGMAQKCLGDIKASLEVAKG